VSKANCIEKHLNWEAAKQNWGQMFSIDAVAGGLTKYLVKISRSLRVIAIDLGSK